MLHFYNLVLQTARYCCRNWLLLALLGLGSGAAQAQPMPRQAAQFQRRRRALGSGYRFWDAPPDSLRRVLARQRADTLRLQTLEHLLVASGSTAAENQELLSLATKLRYPEQVPLRQLVAADVLSQTLPANRLALLDTLQAAQRQFDALGPVPTPILLHMIRDAYDALQQPAGKRAYFQHQLTFYQQHGILENMAACYRALGSYYESQGNSNQAISYRLRAAELFRAFSKSWYYNELGVIGASYAEWGNSTRALPYLQQAANGPGLNGSERRQFVDQTIAAIYLQQKRYSLALHYALRMLYATTAKESSGASIKPVGLVLQSAALLGLGRVAEVRPLLQQAQHLVDSLHLPLASTFGHCELQATWARYYAATGEYGREETAWQAAYRQAQQERLPPLRLAYLHELARFYQQQAQPARAAPYALAALALADTLSKAQTATYVAQYEIEQADRAQQVRIAHLRQAQAQGVAQTKRQHLLLGATLVVLAFVASLGYVLWRSDRRRRRANSLLSKQKTQLEEQAIRLGELDEAKNRFFANVSHELRTPLTLILGPLDTLLTTPPRPLPGAVRTPLVLVYRHAQRLRELVDRILDLTKLAAGRLELHPTPTALAPLLRRAVAQFEALAAERGVALVAPTTLPPDQLHVALDADKFKQILDNLLANALRHTPAGGAVTVSLAPPDSSGQYAVTVRDTGPGIAPTEQTKVFERYYQSPQGPTQGGTGLGLALSRELATLLGGSLTLSSDPGQGAAFTLSFPAPPVATPADVLAPAAPLTTTQPKLPPLPVPAGTRPRVLVVEDQADLREYLRQLLAPTCEVLAAEDGQAALELLTREAPVDLITTDAMMPRLTGTELLAHLRAEPAWQSVPVLMLTARADEAHRLAALKVGVDDYLTKPFVPNELLVRVRTLLARQQVRRQFAALAPEDPEPEPALAAGPLAVQEALSIDAVDSIALPSARRKVLSESANAQLEKWQLLVSDCLANENFGPVELAALLCLSERTLYRRLGELVGLTPAAWLRELRLNQARRLLETGSLGSVAEVADAVGFASAKYFATLYTERFGCRPRACCP